MWTPGQVAAAAASEPYEPAVERYHFHPMRGDVAAAPRSSSKSGAASVSAPVVHRSDNAWSPRSARRRAGKLLKNMVQELNQVGSGDSMRDVARRLGGLLRSDSDRVEFATLLLDRMRRPDERSFIPRYGELVRRLSGAILKDVTAATMAQLTVSALTPESLHLYLFAGELLSPEVHEHVVSCLRTCTEITLAREIWAVYRGRPKCPGAVVNAVRDLATRLADGPPSRSSILAYDVLTTLPPKDQGGPPRRRRGHGSHRRRGGRQ